MASGIDHYREAEKLLAGQRSAERGSGADLSVLLEALCQRAAGDRRGDGAPAAVTGEWGKVAGRQEADQ